MRNFIKIFITAVFIFIALNSCVQECPLEPEEEVIDYALENTVLELSNWLPFKSVNLGYMFTIGGEFDIAMQNKPIRKKLAYASCYIFYLTELKVNGQPLDVVEIKYDYFYN